MEWLLTPDKNTKPPKNGLLSYTDLSGDKVTTIDDFDLDELL